jgi:hypothetical protein
MPSASELLFAPEVPLRRLDGDVAEEKLDLLEFATGQVAQPRARAAKVVRGQLLDAGVRGGRPDDIPEHLRRHPVAPDSAGLVDRAEYGAAGNGGGFRPCIDGGLDPLWDWHRSDVPALADKICTDPVLLTLLY